MEAEMNTLSKIVTIAIKMLGINLDNLEHIYKQRHLNKNVSILTTSIHPFLLLNVCPLGWIWMDCYPKTVPGTKSN